MKKSSDKREGDIALIKERFEYFMKEPLKHVEEIVAHLKANPDKEYIEALELHIDAMRKEFPIEVSEIEEMIKLGKKKGFIKSDTFRDMSNKNKTIAIMAAALGGSVLTADDGSGGETASILLGLTLMAFGIANRQTVASLFKSKSGVGAMADGLKNSMAKGVENIELEGKMNNASNLRKKSAAIADMAYTQIFSTSAPFIKASGKAKEFITKILYNKDFGAGAMTMKKQWFDKAMADYKVAERANFNSWANANGKDTGKILGDQNSMVEFRELILDVKEGIVKSDDKSVNAMVDVLNEKFEDMLMANKDYKTFGFDKIKFSSDYVPRLWRAEVIATVLKGLSDVQVEQFVKALSSSIKGKNADKTARDLVKGWANSTMGSASKSSKEEVIAMLADNNLLKEGEDMDEILDAITGTTDRQSRAKYRIDIDMAVLKEAVDGLGIDGLKFNTILDRNSNSVIDKLGNQMYSSAALSREGITSLVKLEELIVGVEHQDKILGKQARQIQQLLLGTPLDVDNDFLHGLSMALKDLTLGGKLQMVALSTPTEILQTVFSNGFFTGLSSIGKALVHTFGKGSELTHQIAKVGSLGRSTDQMDLIYAHRGFSNEFVDSGETAFSQFREGTMKFRDLIIYFSGLSGITDILQIANKYSHTEQLGKIANGLENSIPLERYGEFGITPERMEALKPYMTFKDGNLQRIDVDSMPRNVKDDYNEMLFNMNQAITPETTVGETPLFSKTSSLGRIITTLVAYPMQQFNLHGIQGVKRMDKYSAIQFMGGVGGTYLGLSARYAILDKEVDDETLFMYSMMNAPQALGIGAIKSFLSPAVMEHNKQMMNMVSLND